MYSWMWCNVCYLILDEKNKLKEVGIAKDLKEKSAVPKVMGETNIISQ